MEQTTDQIQVEQRPDDHMRIAAHHLLLALPDRALKEAQERLCEIFLHYTPKKVGDE